MTARRRHRANCVPFASRNGGAAVLHPSCANGGFRARTSATRTSGNGPKGVAQQRPLPDGPVGEPHIHDYADALSLAQLLPLPYGRVITSR